MEVSERHRMTSCLSRCVVARASAAAAAVASRSCVVVGRRQFSSSEPPQKKGYFYQKEVHVPSFGGSLVRGRWRSCKEFVEQFALIRLN